MLKNIERLKNKKVPVKEEWLVQELYQYKIPQVLLKELKLKFDTKKANTKERQSDYLDVSATQSKMKTKKLSRTPST